MDLAVKDVQRHAGKFAATVVGVGLLVAIVLVMNGIYRGNIADGLWLVAHTDVDLWVVERGRGGPFNEPSRVSQGLYRSVAAIPGVAQASPFITYTVQRVLGGESRQFTIIGYDVLGGLGGPPDVTVGRSIRAPRFEVVADKKLGLRVGQQLHLGLRDYSVVGLTSGAVDLGGNPLLYMALPDAQEVLYPQDNESIRSGRVATRRGIEEQGYSEQEAQRLLPLASAGDTQTIAAVLVRVAPGQSLDAVKRGVEQRLFLGAFTTAEQRELLLKGRLSKMSAVLGLFRILLVIVSVVIMTLIIYVLTMDKIRSIATLKLIGAPNFVIVRLILEQSIVLAALAFGIAYALVSATHDRFPRTLVFETFDTVVTFGVILAGGVVASLFAIGRALRVPPGLALGGG
ncbi:MAG: ABC transporter permease [Deltaproteobacteria bacterium]|nr:ABC transporter permease [Deltaproteobacteria bacterium]